MEFYCSKDKKELLVMSDFLHSRDSTLFFRYGLNNGLSLGEFTMNVLINNFTINEMKDANLPQALVDEISIGK